MEDFLAENDAYFQFFSEEITFELDSPSLVENWLKRVVATENGNIAPVTFIFCSDDYLFKLNVEYLQHDTYTDVITFPYDEYTIEGDVFISIDRVRDNADQLGVSFAEELYRVMVHGLLHLLGYHDKSPQDKATMTQKEDYYLAMWK